MNQPFYSTNEAAREIGITPYKLKYAIERGEIEDPSKMFLGRRMFLHYDVERLKEHFQHKNDRKADNEI